MLYHQIYRELDSKTELPSLQSLPVQPTGSFSIQTKVSSIGQFGDGTSDIGLFTSIPSDVTSIHNVGDSPADKDKNITGIQLSEHGRFYNILKKRKPVFIDDEEVKETLKKLTPIYRRRIFIQQLRSNWYWVVSVIVAIIALSITTAIYILPASKEFVTSSPPPLPIYASWGIVRINGLKAFDILTALKRNESATIDMVVAEIQAIYAAAEIDIDKIELSGYNSSFDQNSRSMALNPTNKHTVLINHIAHLSASSELGVTESEMDKLIRSLRKALLRAGTIVFDPNLLTVRRGSTTVRAHSITTFLNEEFPSFDLALISKRSVFPAAVSVCKALPIIKRGLVTPEDCYIQRKIRTGLSCTTECESGTILSGSRVRICLSSGIWSGWPAICENPCSKLQVPSNGGVSPKICIKQNGAENATDLHGGQSCHFHCNPGYMLFGSLRVVCKSDGQWSAAPPICKETCSGLTPPDHGHVVPKYCYDPWVLEDSFCTFYCDEGYTIYGEVTISCLGNGKWTSSAPFCSKTCPKLTEVENAQVYPSLCWKQSVQSGTSCTLQCRPGYQLSGSYQRVCNSEGKWTGKIQTCLKKCPKIGNRKNLITSLDCILYDSIPGTRCFFSCEAGHEVNGISDILCLRDGSWDDAIPECVPNCEPIPQPDIGNLICTGTVLGSECTLYCPVTYQLIGSQSVICNIIGLWDESIGYCVNTCKKYIVPSYVMIRPAECGLEDSLSGQTCHLHCHDGFDPVGDTETKCGDDGEWSNNSTVCVKQDQFLIELRASSRKLCLTMDPSNSIVYKQDWKKCLLTKTLCKWSLSSSKVFRNGDGKSCLAAQSAQTMSLLEVKKCDLVDPLQLWEWHSTPQNTQIIKLQGYNLYIWEGYLSYSRIMLINNDTAVQAKWTLYDVTRKETFSLYGVIHNGQCEPLNAGPNGRWSPSSCSTSRTKNNSFCSYICEDGFSFAGGISEIHCVNGIWNDTLNLKCAPDCLGFNPSTVAPVKVSPSECTSQYVQEKTVCALDCPDATYQVGEKFVICLKGGTWNAPFPTCIDVCPKLSIENGEVRQSINCTDSNGVHPTSSTCEVDCHESFYPSSMTYNCVDGEWDQDIIKCSRHCQPPWLSVTHGSSDCENEVVYSAGDTCSVSCDDDYELIGNDTITCLINGSWGGEYPSCERACSNCELTDDDYTRFLIWNSMKGSKFCLSAQFYEVLHVHTVVVKDWSDCSPSNTADLWTMDSNGHVKHVGSSKCLSYDQKNATHKFVRLSFCDNLNIAEWMCIVQFGYYQITTSGFYLRHNDVVSTVELTLERHFVRGSYERSSYEWKATDVNGTDGSICGIANDTCPQLLLTKDMSFIPSNETTCSNPVAARDYCHVQCNFGNRRGLSDPGVMHTCMPHGLWDPISIKNCTYTSCNPLALPPYSTVSPSSCMSIVSVGTVCTIDCDAGYVRMSKDNISDPAVCLPNGKWSEESPQCLLLCAPLMNPGNGTISANCVNGTVLLEGDSCSFTCDYDYELVGNETLTCESDGWNAIPPTCSYITRNLSAECSILSNSSNGMITPIDATTNLSLPYGLLASLQCSQSYLPEKGSQTSIKCQGNGQWDGIMGNCVQACPEFQFQNDSMNSRIGIDFNVVPSQCGYNNTNYVGDICQPTCLNSTRIMKGTIDQSHGPYHSTCKSDGNWGNLGFDRSYDCVARYQRKIKSSNGKCLSLKPNNVLLFDDCSNDGDDMMWFDSLDTFISRVNMSLCLTFKSDEFFSEASMELCNSSDPRQRWICTDNELVNHHYNRKLTHFEPSNRLFVTYYRNHDYSSNFDSFFQVTDGYDYALSTRVNDSEMLCRRRSPGYFCEYKQWDNFDDVQTNCSKVTDGLNITWHCDLVCLHNMTNIGIDEMSCSNLQMYQSTMLSEYPMWVPEGVPSCSFICPDLLMPSFAASGTLNCSSDTLSVGVSCHFDDFSCDVAYLEVGSRRRTCINGGHWDGADLTCYKMCPKLDVTHGTISPKECVTNVSLPGTKCNVACDAGHRIDGNSSLICQNDGEWSNFPAICRTVCSPLRSLQNGLITPANCNSSQKAAGDLCMYQCDTGYVLNAATATKQCQSDGLWDDPKVWLCLLFCPPLNAPLNGNLVNESGYNYAVGSVVRTTCDANFVVDRDALRTCLANRRWSGEAAECIVEEHFMLVQESPPSTPICLLTNEDDTIEIKEFYECVHTPRYLWTWETMKLRNIAANKCLQAATNESVSYLTLDNCDDSGVAQNWKCTPFRNRKVLTLANSDLIPAFNDSISSVKVGLYKADVIEFLIRKSFASFSYLQWYNVSSDETRSPICQGRVMAQYCKKLAISSPLMVTPSICLSDTVPLNTVCEFSCPDKYVIKGDTAPAKCDAYGYWNKNTPKCLLTCSRLSLPDLVIANPQYCKTRMLFREGDICRFSCPYGFHLQGEMSAVCLKNGNWSYDSPACVRKCAPLQIPLHGTIQPALCSDGSTSILENTTCVFSCLKTDHVIKGSEYRTCSSNGTWSGMESSCVKPCHRFSTPLNAVVYPQTCTDEKSPPGSNCELSCNTGFLPEDPQYKVCHENGSWIGSFQDCQRYCPALQNFSTNDVIFPLACTYSLLAPGSVCGVKCKNGYSVMGGQSIECLSSGSWSGSLGTCKRKCPVLQRPLHGTIHPLSCCGQEKFAGTICKLTCENIFVASGPTVAICSEDGEWSATELKCQPGCPPIVHVEAATIHPESCKYSTESHQSSCEIQCDKGMVSPIWTETFSLTCMPNGFWDQPIPTKCVKKCKIPLLDNAHVSCVGEIRNGEVLEQEQCVITCQPYHTQISQPLSICIDGDWSPPLAECAYSPYPLIIIHRHHLIAKCLGLEGNDIIMKSWSECKNEDTGTRWTWRTENNIVNSQNGLCMSAFTADIDSPLIVSPCNDLDPLQQWDCDEKEPYRLYLNGTNLGLSLLYEDKFVTLRKSVDVDSLFYSFNPNSDDELGTLCSMRSQGGCHGLTLHSGVHVTPEHCLQRIVLPGTVCRFSCHVNGQFIVGPNVVECQSSGLWHPDSETLCDFHCPPLTIPARAVLYDREDCVFSYAKYRDVCNYVCQEGYTLVADRKGRTCLRNGIWSDRGNVVCSKTCPELKNPLNGQISPQPCVTGTCTLFCNVHFRAEGPRMRTCKETGFWTEQDFTCVPDIQFPISSKIYPLKMRMCLTVVDDTRVVKAHCNAASKSQMWRWKSHFALENVESELCLTMRSEHSDPSTVSARSELHFAEALVHLNESEMESDVHVNRCNVTDPPQRWECETYDSKQPFRFLLKDIGLYLDSGPQFTERVLLFENFTHGSQWAVADYEGITTICSRRDSGVCPPIKHLYGGTIQPLACYSNFIIAGTTCYFQCDGNFVIEGSTSTVCKKDGFWTNSPPSCLGINKCQSLQISSPLTVHPSICNGRKVREGRTCIFRCPDTHKLVGDDHLLCNGNSTWSAMVPLCKSYCHSLSPPHGGSVSPESCQNLENNIGKICKFNCSHGYDIIGSPTLVCKTQGWSETKPVCRKLCPLLLEPRNATILPRSCVTGKSYTGALCTIQCDSGYRSVGNSSTSCNGGIWSNDIGICVIGLCLKIENQTGVRYVSYKDLSNDAIVTGTILEFECEDGYQKKGNNKRICGSDGVWIGGEQLCVLITCNRLPKIFHGSVSPENCQTGDNLTPGSICSFQCDENSISSGTSPVECMQNGKWSTTEFPVCYDPNVVISDRHIMIVSIPAAEHGPSSNVQMNSHCLAASDNNTQPPILTDCLPVSSLKLWRWYGGMRIQNLETALCLNLNEKTELTMADCDLLSESQEMHCGNIASEVSSLQVNIGGLLLSHELKAHIDESSKGVWWMGIEVGNNVIGGTDILQLLHDRGASLCSFMCGGTFTTDSGDFASPNFPNTYPPNVICKWTLNVEGMALVVDMTPIKLSQQYNDDKLHHATDELVIFSGNNSDKMNVDVFRNFRAVREHSQIETQRGILHFEFHSDDTFEDNQQGFAAQWHSRQIQPASESCGANVTTPDDISHGYPWQVAIISWRLLCDGVLVKKRFVLTLAHCVSHVEVGNLPNEVMVAYRIVSRSDFVNKLKRGLWDKADRIWINENYGRETSWNNMAILRLTHGIQVPHDYLHPICLPSPSIGRIDRAGDTCIVASFQKDLIDHVSQSTSFNTISNAVILSEKHCEMLMRYERGLPFDKDYFTCAKILSNYNSALPNSFSPKTDNDGGAVLQCSWNGNWYAVGMKNFVLTNDNDGAYHAFTNIIGGYNWIVRTLEYGFYHPSKTLQ